MLTTIVTEPADTGTATAAQVWARLGGAVKAAHLPTPDAITRNGQSFDVFLQDGHTYTDLCTWIAWLGADPATLHPYVAGSKAMPGYVVRATEAHAYWRGWRITVRWIERVRVESVAVAYGHQPPAGA